MILLYIDITTYIAKLSKRLFYVSVIFTIFDYESDDLDSLYFDDFGVQVQNCQTIKKIK